MFSGNSLTNLEVNLVRIGKCLKTFLILLILFANGSLVFSQSVLKIDYFGVISSEIDENMYKLTSDLYYTQLCEINNFSVTDKRKDSALTTAPSNSEMSSDSLSFYTIIEKTDASGKWQATLIVINKGKKEKKSQTKEYDSYYKILMEPKSVLQDTIKSLINSNETQSITEESVSAPVISSDESGSVTENLSGTWIGEDIIDKIVIMRGGRGFVIFKNGASMNITVNTSNESDAQIEIIQNARANASFYPDLPRQLALKEAVNADPIKWSFTLVDNNTLSGTKTTLIADGDSVHKGSINVTWNRKN